MHHLSNSIFLRLHFCFCQREEKTYDSLLSDLKTSSNNQIDLNSKYRVSQILHLKYGSDGRMLLFIFILLILPTISRVILYSPKSFRTCSSLMFTLASFERTSIWLKKYYLSCENRNYFFVLIRTTNMSSTVIYNFYQRKHKPMYLVGCAY